MKEIRIFNLKFRGIDDFHRPVFKDTERALYFGSVNKLFSGNTPPAEIIAHFKNNLHDLEFFGGQFNCEPNGGRAENWVFNIVE